MSKRIHTEVLIDSEPARVWAVLTDFAGHAAWDPFLTAITGDLAVGQSLTVHFSSGQTFHPVVTEVRAGKSFEWCGTLLASWIFAGRHRFDLVEEGGGTRLIHSETFTGLLVPFLGSVLAKAALGFGELNAALKRRVEERPHGAEARDHP
jgi:hypothetical protein